MSDSGENDETRRAVALAYQHGEDLAPRVVAQGYDELAEQIVAEARRHGIFVHDSPELVDLLMKLDLDERIPPNLYAAVAELLVWLREIKF